MAFIAGFDMHFYTLRCDGVPLLGDLVSGLGLVGLSASFGLDKRMPPSSSGSPACPCLLLTSERDDPRPGRSLVPRWLLLMRFLVVLSGSC
jgi:hypothetical protein